MPIDDTHLHPAETAEFWQRGLKTTTNPFPPFASSLLKPSGAAAALEQDRVMREPRTTALLPCGSSSSLHLILVMSGPLNFPADVSVG